MLEFEKFDCERCKKNTLPAEELARGFINCGQDFHRVIYWRDLLCYCRSYEEAENGQPG